MHVEQMQLSYKGLCQSKLDHTDDTSSALYLCKKRKKEKGEKKLVKI